MNEDAGRRMGTTRVPAHSANISGSNFGDNTRIQQVFQNIFFRNWRNSMVSPESTPSPAVQAQLEEKERMDCRRSLSFRDLDTRLLNISPVQQGTCEWIFQMPLFQNWHEHNERGNGLLWIKGNPGTGKSTLMKHILQYCQTKGKYVIATYFFNARGAKLEQTPLGMLRSLLFQLLRHEPRLYDQLLPNYRQKQEDHSSGDWEWHEQELKSFFLSEIPKCQSGPLLLIIDALDECNKDDMQNVAEFLQHLSKNATDVGLTLNICLSSRHFPSIHLAEYQELVLEKEEKHDEDIIKYISSNLTKKDEEIEEAIRKKSSGIFMWVVLVISMLNRAYEDGKIEFMKPMLDKMPAKLEEVFAMLLDGDYLDKDETILIMQCVLLAKRPLTPGELYFAIIAGTNSEALGIWDPLKITPDIIRRRIISSSRGLVEIRKGEVETNEGDETSEDDETGEGEKETVQFIHGSVNDFLVRNSRLQKLDPRLIPDPIAESHGRLKGCCMAYVMMKSLELQNIEGIESRFPFLEYASRYLFDHAEEATSVGQAKLLRALEHDTVFKRVERFHNYFVDYGQKRAPLSLLHILAARGLPKLVESLLDRGADINAEGVPCGTALEAAIEFHREETVKTLLRKRAKIDLHGKHFYRTTLSIAFDKGNKEILAMLIDRGAKLGILERIVESGMLSHAVETGDKDIIAMVLERGAKVNSIGLGTNALSTAATEGDEDIVRMLLEKGAKIHMRGLLGNSLAFAALGGNIQIVKLLLEKGAKIHSRGLLGCPPFAAMNGDIEVVKLLLEKGAKIHTRGFFGSPLACAAIGGHIEVANMLLEKGANIHARGFFGSPLACAATDNQVKTVEWLLEKGAKINAERSISGGALHTAVMNGDREVVEMLLKNGANVDARGLIGPLYLFLKFAGLIERKEIPKILLEKGFKVKSWGKFYGTALQAAVTTKQREEMIQLLLDNGAKI